MSIRTDYFGGNAISLDFFDAICGERLGGGVSRDVFVCKINPDLVVKIDSESSQFQNITEWKVWNELRAINSPLIKWLAPCHSISPCGNVLIQSRTAPLRRREMKRYGSLPEFLTDRKMENYGIINGKLVCHDYGHVNWTLGGKMTKVDWGER